MSLETAAPPLPDAAARAALAPSLRLHAAVVFLGAFLLFLAEPLVAKMLLPLFGGSAAVWIAALLFFQAALLAGYAYADALARRLSPRAQAAAHCALLALGLLALPLAPSERVRGVLASLPPTAQVVGVLAAALGLPYLSLSATGPLVQAFWARGHAGSPYRLYALSNLASMLGLLCYPALVEPALGLRAQSLGWSAAYALFAVLSATLAVRAARAAPPPAPAGSAPAAAAPEAAAPAPTLRAQALWVALPLASSLLLSAVTSDLTLNVAPVPLLWVLPLAAYLLSFILCFESDRIYSRGRNVPAVACALAFIASRAGQAFQGEHTFFEIAASLTAFFLCAMALHGELVRLRPAPRFLTRFYLLLALGGALGGAFVAVAAPLLFRTQLELAVGVVLTACLMAAVLWNARPVLRGQPLQRVLRAALLLGIALLAGRLALREARTRRAAVAYERGFHGPVRIEQPFAGSLVDEDDDEPGEAPRHAPHDRGRVRMLVHGTTVHGIQRLLPARALEPAAYYAEGSGVGLLVRALQEEERPLRIGVIGLGAGVMAAYCRPQDQYAFYEIDPLIVSVAHTWFGFLRECPQAQVVLGDARLLLQQRPPEGLDALIIDAFSGDAVPVHLLTAEAFRLFATHLRAGGVLALHVSNRFLDLEPVVASSAQSLGLPAVLVDDDGDEADDVFSTRWMLAAPAPRLQALGLSGETFEPVPVPPGFRPWTDDYSNLAGQLRTE